MCQDHSVFAQSYPLPINVIRGALKLESESQMWGESMETPHTNAFILSFLLLNLAFGRVAGADTYSRDDFPVDFIFGSGTSAYQVSTEFLFFFLFFSFFFFYQHFFFFYLSIIYTLQ